MISHFLSILIDKIYLRLREMSRIKTFWGIVALLAVLAEAAGTITPKTPVTLEGCYFITSKEELYGFAAIVNGTEDKEPYCSGYCRFYSVDAYQEFPRNLRRSRIYDIRSVF